MPVWQKNDTKADSQGRLRQRWSTSVIVTNSDVGCSPGANYNAPLAEREESRSLLMVITQKPTQSLRHRTGIEPRMSATRGSNRMLDFP
jgi:hypothetical protein